MIYVVLWTFIKKAYLSTYTLKSIKYYANMDGYILPSSQIKCYSNHLEMVK